MALDLVHVGGFTRIRRHLSKLVLLLKRAQSWNVNYKPANAFV